VSGQLQRVNASSVMCFGPCCTARTYHTSGQCLTVFWRSCRPHIRERRSILDGTHHDSFGSVYQSRE